LSIITHTSPAQIDQDLGGWATSNSIDLTPSLLTELLTHRYNFQRKTPHSNWKVELSRLQAVAQTGFFFSPYGIFVREDPDQVLSDSKGYCTAGLKYGKKWSGSYKTVYRVRLANDSSHQIYALIRVKNGISPREKENYEAALSETTVLKHINELTYNKAIPGIISLSWMVQSPDSKELFILLPFYNKGAVYQLTRSFILDHQSQYEITEQLLKGILFLKNHQIAHRDIKPQNILIHQDEIDSYLGGDLKAALSDFGASYFETQPGIQETLAKEDVIRTTYHYAAPEIIERFYLRRFRENKIGLDTQWRELKLRFGLNQNLKLRWNPEWADLKTDQAADLWSLGLSLLEIFSSHYFGSQCWSRIKNPLNPRPKEFLAVQQIDVDRTLGKLSHFPFQSRIPDQIATVLKCLLRVNPAERCTPEEALALLKP
jgi:serine/threonine protein kinase